MSRLRDVQDRQQEEKSKTDSMFYLVLLLLQQFFPHYFLPPVPLRISPQTTLITDPVTSDGIPDYVGAARLEREKREVPLERNSMPLLVRAFGRDVLQAHNQPDVLAALGNPEPLPVEQRLTLQRDFPEDPLDDPEKPWTREQFPQVADWIDRNERALELVAAAVQKPSCYAPISGHIQSLREVGFDTVPFAVAGQLLFRRALWHLGNSDEAAALRDTHTLIALTERLTELDERLLPFLVSAAFRNKAGVIVRILATRYQGDEAKLHLLLDAWNTTPREPSPNCLRHELLISLEHFVKEVNAAPPPGLDYNLVLEQLVRDYRRVESAFSDSSFGRGQSRLLSFTAPHFVEGMRRLWRHPTLYQIEKMIVGPRKHRRRLSRRFARSISPLMAASYEQALRKHTEHTTKDAITTVALLLEIHYSRLGRYPSGLADLARDLRALVPVDPFSGKCMRYRRTSTGYMIYSVGPNLEDEGTGDDDIMWEVPPY